MKNKSSFSYLLPIARFSQIRHRASDGLAKALWRGLIRLRRSLILLAYCLILSSCASEVIRRQEAEIHSQREELARLKAEGAELQSAKRREAEKRQDCNRAFREFERAQEVTEPEAQAALYRKGLEFCADDDVAHYELGKILRRIGRKDEARHEFEAALKINPNFRDAKAQMEALK